MFVPLACCGAQILEKHFMIDENMDCVDSSVSITEKQMKKLVKQIRRIETIMGSTELKTRECENGALTFRRKS